MLYAPSESDDPTYRALVAERIGGICDYFDARFETPDPALLSTYDCVHTFASYAYGDPVVFGNRLARYVDAGGKVVLGSICAYPAGNFLAGDIVAESGRYSPIRCGAHDWSSLACWDGTARDCCVHVGVPLWCSVHRDLVTELNPEAEVCGRFGDGQVAVAHNPERDVFYVNGSGGFPVMRDVNVAYVVANACACGGVVPVRPSSWGVLKLIYR
jgi:hypothetical protein